MNNLNNFEDNNISHQMQSLQNFSSNLSNSNLCFKCKICNKSFPKSKGLNRHMKLHGEKIFKCEKCDKSYSRSDHLKRHLISHGEDKKPFSCQLCIQKFSNKSHLNRHIKIIHSENTEKFNFKCYSCEEKFDKKFKLNKHTNKFHRKLNNPDDCSNSNNKSPYECYYPFCQRKFTTYRKQQLHINNKHKKSSIIETNTSMAFPNHIQNEQRITFKTTNNSMNTNLQCPFENCYKTYTTTFNLKTHIKTFHYRLKEFKCDESNCNQSFKHKCSLEKHKIRYHNNYKINHITDSNSSLQNFENERSQMDLQKDMEIDLINIGEY